MMMINFQIFVCALCVWMAIYCLNVSPCINFIQEFHCFGLNNCLTTYLAPAVRTGEQLNRLNTRERSFCTQAFHHWSFSLTQKLNKLISCQHAFTRENTAAQIGSFYKAARVYAFTYLNWNFANQNWVTMSHIQYTNSDAQKERGNLPPTKTCLPCDHLLWKRAGVMGNGRPQHTKID